MRRRGRIALTLGGVMALAFAQGALPPPANAVASFARQTNQACSACHTAWPLLNRAGRAFRDNGFKVSRKDGRSNILSKSLQFDEGFPVSAVVVSRPYDKKSSGDAKIRAVHEAELMVAGGVSKDVSVFFELAAEDENDFKPEIESGRVGYHPSEAFNVTVSWGEMFTADSYDTLSGSRRLSRGRNSVIDQAYGGADNGGALRGARQSVQLSGRPIAPLFYNFGISAVADDTEGVNPNNYNARLAYDVTPDIMVGAFGVIGQCATTAANCATERDFNRFGIDTQATFGNARVMAAFVKANDEDPVGATEDNRAWYIEGLYARPSGVRPLLVPSLRIDWYEQNNGADRFTEGTLNLTYYPWENVKGFFEVMKQFNVPTGMEEDERFTVQFVVGF